MTIAASDFLLGLPAEHTGFIRTYISPLDLVSGAMAAYSQRAMGATKFGSALYTIRESAGNTTQSFNSDATTGAAPVTAITTFLNGANGFATVWNDQSTNANDLAQATAAAQPEWLASQVGGMPSLDFNTNSSSPSMLTAAAQTYAVGEITLFWVCRGAIYYNARTASGPACQIGAAFSDPFLDIFNGADEVFSEFDDTPVTITLFHLWEFTGRLVGGVADVSCKVDGVDMPPVNGFVSGAGSVPGFTAILHVIGQDGFSSSAEILAYNSILSAGNRTLIRQNIAAYYGIAL